MVDTLHPPLSVIATFPKPNYIDPTTRGSGLIYICIIFASLGIVTGAARLYSRLFITKALGLDDLLVTVSIGFLTALNILVIVGNKDYYNGRHIWDIPPDSFVGGRANIWASLWCYVIGITLIKISVLLFYRRLSVKFSKMFLIATWIGIVYNVLYFFSFGLTLLLMCRPMHAYWDSFNPVWAKTHHFHCVSEGAALPASSAFSVVGDFYSTILPLILVYHLELPRRQKFALYALFCLGFMAVAAGVVRTVLMYRLLNVDYDFTWLLWLTWVWAVLELYLALFAASAPSLKPFFRHFFVESVSSIARGSKKNQGHGIPVSNDADRDPKHGQENAGFDKYVVHARASQIGLGFSADVERDAMNRQDKHAPDRSASQQSWFVGSTGDTSTRHFEMQSNRDGRGMIPMRVYKEAQEQSNQQQLHREYHDGTSIASDPFTDPRDQSRDQSHNQRKALPPTPRDWPLAEAHQQLEPHEFIVNSRHSSYNNMF